jgi:hypothetical protein
MKDILEELEKRRAQARRSAARKSVQRFSVRPRDHEIKARA